MTTIPADRLAWLDAQTLREGSHPDQTAACVMEAVAYVAGEQWSDRPQCACPVMTAFLINWNDNLPSDADRDRLLKPLVPRIVGTRSTKEVELRRSWMAFDWLVRVQTPAWLDLAGLSDRAAELRALGEIDAVVPPDAALPLLDAARQEAYAAWLAAGADARAAAKAAAWDAAWDAARDAARDAAWAAAWAAWEAAGAAAWTAWDAARAARAAARDAAGAVARGALAPTVVNLQTSALELVERMIAADHKEAPDA